MEILLTDEELVLFQAIPEVDLVDLAVELDIPVGEEIDRARLLSRAVVGLADLARGEGLPFSPYDEDDLAALPPVQLEALARALGTRADIGRILKGGRKLYKIYRKKRSRSQIPMMLPMLLGPVSRYLAEGPPPAH